MSHVVIVGASVAGGKLALNLRSQGFTGDITLVDAEDDPFYDKPPLSKEYLSGAFSAEDIALGARGEFRRGKIVTCFGTAAASLDPATKTLTLEDGRTMHYDVIVIATGARARLTPWASLEGVYVLRTRADADRLREAIVPERHLAVIGAGFIGAEAAATAVKAGMRVTIIEPLEAPMGRAMNAEVGEIFADKHRREGVEFRFGVSVENVEPAGDRRRLLRTDGSSLEVDAVLLGSGAVPNTEWLESSGVLLQNGILCDATLAAVGVPGVYAIGDVARFANDHHPDTVRHEHWTSAADQALIVARNIVHPDEPRAYEAVEYVWSDQYDWKIQIVGRTGSRDWKAVGDPADDRFAVVYGTEAERISGVVVVNWPRALVDARRSVAAGVPAQELIDRLSELLSPSEAAV